MSETMERDTAENWHLVPTRSDRGFSGLPSIPSEYGGYVRVYESSAAMEPHIWLSAEAPVDLNDPTGPTHQVPIHLTAENAWRLAEQINLLVRTHYQGDAMPDWARSESGTEGGTR